MNANTCISYVNANAICTFSVRKVEDCTTVLRFRKIRLRWTEVCSIIVNVLRECVVSLVGLVAILN